MHSPQTIDELRRLIETASSSLHALGTRHSFNDIADAAGLISLEALPGEMTIDEDARSVSVPAAMRYGNLARQLHEAGWALSNLPSLPHITVASSVATATHGSGNANQSLASAVTAMNLITGSGDRLPDAAAVEALVERIEQVLQPFQPRPHWSKVFGAGHDWSGLYPALRISAGLPRRTTLGASSAHPFLHELSWSLPHPELVEVRSSTGSDRIGRPTQSVRLEFIGAQSRQRCAG